MHSVWALAAHLIAEPCPAAEDAAYELNAEITAQRSDVSKRSCLKARVSLLHSEAPSESL